MRWLVLLVVIAGCTKEKPPLRVAAAADLTDVLDELGRRFEAETKTKVVFAFGSSGLLAKQVTEGAPFDVFASANRGYVDEVVQAGACDGATAKPYARGRIVLWSRDGTATLAALNDEANKRIAIANPEHAPYGRAAKEALEKSGLWDAVQPRLVFAENVRQALQLAETGNAELAFGSWSNVIHRDAGSVLLLDASLHAPIEQTLVQCKRGENPNAAKKFIEFLMKPESRALLQNSGFE